MTCPIDHVENSPLSINVTDVKLCIINSPLPNTLQIRQQQSIQVDISQAGPGDFTVQSSDPSIVATKASKRGNFSVEVLFDPIALGKVSTIYIGYRISRIVVGRLFKGGCLLRGEAQNNNDIALPVVLAE